MKVLVQRSQNSFVTIDNQIFNEIKSGMVIFVGFTSTDNQKTIDYLINKIINLRIFADENKAMNKNIIEAGGEVLAISQFTLYADTTKGNRPSYVKALNSKEAEPLYEYFVQELKKKITTKTGVFGADMLVNINNDGPVTILLEK